MVDTLRPRIRTSPDARGIIPIIACATTTASQLRLPDGAGWRIGQALGHANREIHIFASVPCLSRRLRDLGVVGGGKYLRPLIR